MSQTIRLIVMVLMVAAVELPGDALGQSSQNGERERNRTRRDISPFQTNYGTPDQYRPSNRRQEFRDTDGSRNRASGNAQNQSASGRPGQGQPNNQTVRAFTRTQTTAAGGRLVGAGNSATTGTAARASAPGAPGGKGSPAIPAGATFAMSGKINEVTKSMADSLRPMRVDYDAEEMARRPSVIILNPRRYQTGRDSNRGEGGRSAESLVRPL